MRPHRASLPKWLSQPMQAGVISQDQALLLLQNSLELDSQDRLQISLHPQTPDEEEAAERLCLWWMQVLAPMQ